VLQPFHLYVDKNSLIDFETVFNELNFFAFDWHFYLSLKTKFILLFSQFWNETLFNSSRTTGLWLLAHCSVLINIYIFMFSVTFFNFVTLILMFCWHIRLLVIVFTVNWKFHFTRKKTKKWKINH
jgi:hypothetical protein